MRSMSKAPDAYLKARGKNNYYSIQVTIPKVLRKHYPQDNGGHHIKIIESLGTNNLSRARLLRDVRVAAIFLGFEYLKNGEKPTSLRENTVEAIQDEIDRWSKAIKGGNEQEAEEASNNIDAMQDYYYDKEPDGVRLSADSEHLRKGFSEMYGRTSIQFITDEYLKSKHGFSQSTKKKILRYSKQFIAYLGKDTDPKSVTTYQVMAFVQDLNQQTHKGHKVKRDTLSGLNSLWSWAKRNNYLRENIFEGTRKDIHVPTTGKANSRYPSSNRDTVEILEGILTLGDKSKKLASLTLICLYTGMRVGEVATLKTTDVFEDYILDIKQGKNSSSIRKIPTHRVLHPLMDILIGTSTDGWLIPNSPSNETSRKAHLSSVFSAYKQKLWGANSRPEITLHSFRHRMEDLIRETSAEDSTRSQLMGRKEVGSGKSYGRGYSIKKMRDSISRIDQSKAVDEAVTMLINTLFK